MKNLYFLLLISAIYLAASCNKSDDELPSIETHENKFFFLWDGTPVYDTSDIDYKMEAKGVLFEDNDYFGATPELKIKSNRYGYETVFKFYIAVQPFKTGIQDFYTHRFQDHISRYNDIACGNYFIVQNMPSSMEITMIDREKQIVKGKFSYTAYNHCSDTVKVTEGYFI